tara:strand:+ start:19052 stop:19771 length:720 start_codon:yes stop_codon:yes gene_type:complete
MKIACWSGPRNISTALMRSWSSRNDTFVSDEPFYAYYLKKTGLNHPMAKQIVEYYPSSYSDIITYLEQEIPYSKSIWYQKHMAHHLLDSEDINWINNFKNCFLIRHPKKVISSYIVKNNLKSIYELGYLQQWKLIQHLLENQKKIFVIDSSQILNNPELSLGKWCNWLNINFDPKMLSWKKGYHQNDGIWAKHWYNSVILSNRFINEGLSSDKENSLNSKYDKIYEEAMEYYNLMLGLV